MAAKKLTQEQILEALDKIYDKSIQGIKKVSPPIDVLATEYLQTHADVETAAQTFVKYQIAKCTTSGFLTSLGGIITLPVTIPANIGSVLYVQMRKQTCT